MSLPWPHFTLQKMWAQLHPAASTLQLLHSLVLELTFVDDPNSNSNSNSDSNSDDEDDEAERARKEALGLGGDALKAVLKDLNGADSGSATKDIPISGGETLSILSSSLALHSGSPLASKLFSHLLREAGRPYVGMVREWVGKGRLRDGQGEFVVRENRGIGRESLESDYTDEYWERRYTVSCFLQFLKVILTLR